MTPIGQRIENAQTRINGLRDQLNAHLETHDGNDDATTTVTDTLTSQLETEEKSLATLKRAEASLARAAAGTSLSVIDTQTVETRGATTVGVHDTTLSPRGRTFAVPAAKIRPADYIFKAVATSIKHYGDQKRPVLDVLKDCYGDGEVGETVRKVMSLMITKAAAIPADTTTSHWATDLVQTVIGDFIQSLLPYSVYPAISAKGSSFTYGRNGVISLPARTLATAVGGAFIAQGAAIPVKQGAFNSITLTPKKMGVITTMTREITEHSIPAIEAIIRQAMLEDTGVAIDTVLLDATAADTTRPAGLKSGITKVTASATATIVGFVADIKALTAALITATAGNIRAPAWIMNPGDVLAASLLQTTVGETPFREELSQGTLLGYPIVQSTTGLNDMMGIIDCADFITATGDTPNFSVSDQAVLHMEDTNPAALSGVGTPNTVVAPIRSLWQTDSIAIRMIMDINWAKRRTGVFQWTDTMAWN